MTRNLQGLQVQMTQMQHQLAKHDEFWNSYNLGRAVITYINKDYHNSIRSVTANCDGTDLARCLFVSSLGLGSAPTPTL